MSPRKRLWNLGTDTGVFDDIRYQQTSIPRRVMLELLDLAIEIAREGREGRKIGTLFIVGDEDEGARHVAAASITKHTSAIAVVVSESSIVRIFNGGMLMTEILPELWLLSRFSSHIRHPRTTEHPRENIAVLSREPEAPP